MAAWGAKLGLVISYGSSSMSAFSPSLQFLGIVLFAALFFFLRNVIVVWGVFGLFSLALVLRAACWNSPGGICISVLPLENLAEAGKKVLLFCRTVIVLSSAALERENSTLLQASQLYPKRTMEIFQGSRGKTLKTKLDFCSHAQNLLKWLYLWDQLNTKAITCIRF